MQNATLAGGVAVGAVADTVLYPWGALLVGLGSGIVSVLGYRFITVSSSSVAPLALLRDIRTVLSVLIVGVYSSERHWSCNECPYCGGLLYWKTFGTVNKCPYCGGLLYWETFETVNKCPYCGGLL